MRTNRRVVMIALAMLFGSTTASLAASEQRQIEISVTAKGFEPARIEVLKDQPLRLVVTRKTDQTCAKQIVIPEANIKADLPLDKPVTLSFTPKRSGELKYTCGMNMLTGVLQVSSRDSQATGSAADAMSSRRTMGEGMTGNGGMMCGGMMGGSMQEMHDIHGLLSDRAKIQRSVKDIPNGVETTTTSGDSQVSKLIREHVWQMKTRIESGQPIRQMDPLFREIFKNHQHIHMKIAEIPGGVRVAETADVPNVVPLVRQHARRAVSEFIAEGMPRVMRPTPLPPGYVPSEGPDQRHLLKGSGCGCMGRT